MIAAVAVVGMPSVSRGTRPPAAEALLVGLRAGDALDGSLAELLRVLGQLLLHRVGEEGRDLGATGRHGAEREADRGAAQPRLPRARPVVAGHLRAVDVHDLERRAAQVRRDPEGLADGEEPDRDDDDVDAVGELGDAERQPLLARGRVDADEPDEQADAERREPAHLRRAEHRRDRDEGEHHDGEVVGRPHLHGDLDDDRREQRQAERADRAGDEGADGGRRERRRPSTPLGHEVALDGGDDRGALTGGVEQDRGRRPAVHAAVVDAGEHDEGLRRLERVGDGEQQRDRHGRADARQHADGRAEQHAEEGVEQVDRRQRRGEALDEGVDAVHQRIPFSSPTGSLIPRPA